MLRESVSRALDKARQLSTEDLITFARKMPLPSWLKGSVDRVIDALVSNKFTGKHKAALIFALVYLVTFNDVLPDIFAGGLMDDLAVISAVLAGLPSEDG